MLNTFATTVLLLTARLAAAILFSDWDPQGLQPEFRPFLQALVNAAEDPDVTTGYTDYFAKPDGMQTTLTIHCVGAEEIQKCKERFLVNGRRIVHFPNTTSIIANNETATVYSSLGRIEQTYPEPINNCSQLYYRTEYTILKTELSVDAPPNLSTEPQGQVYWYHDVEVDPPALISDIPCDSIKLHDA